jgi:hypothetical protein
MAGWADYVLSTKQNITNLLGQRQNRKLAQQQMFQQTLGDALNRWHSSTEAEKKRAHEMQLLNTELVYGMESDDKEIAARAQEIRDAHALRLNEIQQEYENRLDEIREDHKLANDPEALTNRLKEAENALRRDQLAEDARHNKEMETLQREQMGSNERVAGIYAGQGEEDKAPVPDNPNMTYIQDLYNTFGAQRGLLDMEFGQFQTEGVQAVMDAVKGLMLSQIQDDYGADPAKVQRAEELVEIFMEAFAAGEVPPPPEADKETTAPREPRSVSLPPPLENIGEQLGRRTAGAEPESPFTRGIAEEFDRVKDTAKGAVPSGGEWFERRDTVELVKKMLDDGKIPGVFRSAVENDIKILEDPNSTEEEKGWAFIALQKWTYK